ncbi:LAETG motif-containing sortase-dependent surface protein [Streptomyces sp. NPDC001941]|uniref:LAETG motif-containing sortase-dependent surface protein n=1 Tax=Streptomyces sp. NPDC001941 TaxID=3154659 RepID=UPI00332722EA
MSIATRSRRSIRVLGVAAVVAASSVALAAGPASAHTPTWSVTCNEVTVDLKYYGEKADNSVTITVDGTDLLPTEKFGDNFNKTLALPAHDKEAKVRLVVKAGDGPQYSVDETKTSPVCEKPPTTPPATPPASPSPKPSPSTSSPETSPSPSTSSSSAAPAPKPSSTSPNLAETGSSSSTPVIGGAAAAALLAGGGVLWAVRKRRTQQG